jgi:hypothetical protein
MLTEKIFRLFKLLLGASIILFSLATLVYAKNSHFHFTYFDISPTDKLSLVSKFEDNKNKGFYRYVFASSNDDKAELEMRLVVSGKAPEKGESLEQFQTDAIGAMSTMFMDAHHLYQYINTPENSKVLSSKPDKIKLGSATYAGATMYFGDTSASFLVTHVSNMTFAFTLISRNSSEQTRKNNLTMLTQQLESIKFNSEMSALPGK